MEDGIMYLSFLQNLRLYSQELVLEVQLANGGTVFEFAE